MSELHWILWTLAMSTVSLFFAWQRRFSDDWIRVFGGQPSRERRPADSPGQYAEDAVLTLKHRGYA